MKKKMSLADLRNMHGFKTDAEKAAELEVSEKAAKKAAEKAERAAKKAAEEAERAAKKAVEEKWEQKGYELINFSVLPLYSKHVFALKEGEIVAYCHHVHDLIFAVKKGIVVDSYEDYEDAETFFIYEEKVYRKSLKNAQELWSQVNDHENHIVMGIIAVDDSETVREALSRYHAEQRAARCATQSTEQKPRGQWVRTARGCYWKEETPSSNRERSYGGHRD